MVIEPPDNLKFLNDFLNKARQAQNEMIPTNVNWSYDSVQNSHHNSQQSYLKYKALSQQISFLFYHNIAKNNFYYFKTLVVENETWSIIAHNGSYNLLFKGGRKALVTIVNMSSIFKTTHFYPKNWFAMSK